MKTARYLMTYASIGMFIVCTGMTKSPVHAGQGVQASQSGQVILLAERNGRIKLAAGGNPAICKANYDQCISGCGGFAQCNNQCAANYRGCLGQ
jgi:hypothetical protein